MTTRDKIAWRKARLLELASEMSEVSKAGRKMSCSRRRSYEITRNDLTRGANSLRQPLAHRIV